MFYDKEYNFNPFQTGGGGGGAYSARSDFGRL